MTHPKINAKQLARRLKEAVGDRPYVVIAQLSRIDVSRVTRFLNGDFKKLTPVLSRLCDRLGVPTKQFLIESPPSRLPPEILDPLRRIVGRDAQKVIAATRLLRSLEVLALGRHSRRGISDRKNRKQENWRGETTP